MLNVRQCGQFMVLIMLSNQCIGSWLPASLIDFISAGALLLDQSYHLIVSSATSVYILCSLVGYRMCDMIVPCKSYFKHRCLVSCIAAPVAWQTLCRRSLLPQTLNCSVRFLSSDVQSLASGAGNAVVVLFGATHRTFRGLTFCRRTCSQSNCRRTTCGTALVASSTCAPAKNWTSGQCRRSWWCTSSASATPGCRATRSTRWSPSRCPAWICHLMFCGSRRGPPALLQ